MSRKSDLLKESDRVLNFHRTGSPVTRHWRKMVMVKIINQLICLKIAPPSFKHFEASQVQALIQFWKKRGLSESTIAKHLGVLRFFFRTASVPNPLPSNQELKIFSPRKTATQANSFEDLIQKPEHRFTRSILAFQLYFGLSKTESMRLNLNIAAQNHFLFIDRSIAHNRKDRAIPLLTAEQVAAIEIRRSLLTDKNRLIELCPEGDLRALFKADLLIQKLDPNGNFRAHYAKTRWQSLLQTSPESEAWKTLQAEMGMSSKYPLESWL